ncbi:MAG: flagellar biosynthesis anti-sigma factor FlgM [Sphingomonadaceae bacterium]|nr:flagellar biosynthesis anti-sigma factor FlgM [Sphingomonadaceae bacterium]
MSSMELRPVRAVSAVDLSLAHRKGGQDDRMGQTNKTDTPVVKSNALDPGKPPVDAERVAMIRKAIEGGNYPILPMKVADAMIAAGELLRSGR